MKKGNQIRAHAKYVTLGYSDEEQGIEIKVLKRSGENELNNDSASHEIKVNEQKMKDLTMEAWRTLAFCDDMTGMHCGAAVKQGYDCTVTWLFSAVAFGGQVVASATQIRNSKSNQNVILSSDELDLSACDFGVLKENQSHADEIVANPIPIPEVVIRLKKIMEESNNLSDVEIELRYCISMLEYVQKRLLSKEHGIESFKKISLKTEVEDKSIGCFLNLRCGHNNQYSFIEKQKLKSFLLKISDN